MKVAHSGRVALTSLCDEILEMVADTASFGIEGFGVDADVPELLKQQAEAAARRIFALRQIQPSHALSHYKASQDGFPHDPVKARAWLDANGVVRRCLDMGPLFNTDYCIRVNH